MRFGKTADLGLKIALFYPELKLSFTNGGEIAFWGPSGRKTTAPILNFF